MFLYRNLNQLYHADTQDDERFSPFLVLLVYIATFSNSPWPVGISGFLERPKFHRPTPNRVQSLTTPLACISKSHISAIRITLMTRCSVNIRAKQCQRFNRATVRHILYGLLQPHSDFSFTHNRSLFFGLNAVNN